jgi:hypothetical protein
MVDWSALGQVVVYAFAGTVAVTLLFTAGVLLGTGEGRAPAPRLAVAGVALRGEPRTRGARALRDAHNEVVPSPSLPEPPPPLGSGQSWSRGCCCSCCWTGAVEGSGVVVGSLSVVASATAGTASAPDASAMAMVVRLMPLSL